MSINNLKIELNNKMKSLEKLTEWYNIQESDLKNEILILESRIKEEENKIKSLTKTEEDFRDKLIDIREKIKKCGKDSGVSYYSNSIEVDQSIDDIQVENDFFALVGFNIFAKFKYSDILNFNETSTFYDEEFEFFLNDNIKFRIIINLNYS